MERARPASYKRPGATSGTTSSSRIPPKTSAVRSKSPGGGSIGRAKSPATIRKIAQVQALSKENAKRSLTRAGGRAVAASLKNGAGTNHTDQGNTARKTSLTISRRDKPPPHPKLSTTTTTTVSSPSQGRVRGIRTATAAKVQPLKIPPALKRCVHCHV